MATPLTETASNFTLTETGTLGSTTTETGNTVTGAYTTTITGTDAYSMVETGTNIGGAFSEVVTGTDTVTSTETGNSSTGIFERTIVGTGTYSLTDSGAGATLSDVPSGTLSYNLQESGDSLGAVFNQTQTGADRYDLLQSFIDVSNTSSGNSPGNMNFSPFGQAFVDPLPDTVLPVLGAATGIAQAQAAQVPPPGIDINWRPSPIVVLGMPIPIGNVPVPGAIQNRTTVQIPLGNSVAPLPVYVDVVPNYTILGPAILGNIIPGARQATSIFNRLGYMTGASFGDNRNHGRNIFPVIVTVTVGAPPPPRTNPGQ